MRAWPLIALLAFACSADDADKDTTDKDTVEETDTVVTDTDITVEDTDATGGDTDTNSGTNTDEPTCDSEIVSFTPADGEPDFARDGSFNIIFTEDEASTATATLEVTATGDDVPLAAPTWSGFGRIVSVSAAAELTAGVEYTFTLDYSCGTEVVTFIATDLGEPVDAADVIDRTYVLDLSSISITEPVGLGNILGGFLTNPDGTAAIRVLDIDESNDRVDLELGIVTSDGAASWEQDQCVPTLPAPDMDYSSPPAWSATAPSLPLEFGGFSLELLNVDIGGVFAPGGDFIGDITISGEFDTGPVSEALLQGNPGAICFGVALATQQGVTCGACPAPNGATRCLSITIEDARAYPAAPFVLEGRTQVDIDADITCNAP